MFLADETDLWVLLAAVYGFNTLVASYAIYKDDLAIVDIFWSIIFGRVLNRIPIKQRCQEILIYVCDPQAVVPVPSSQYGITSQWACTKLELG